MLYSRKVCIIQMNQETNQTTSAREGIRPYIFVGLATFFVVASGILVFFTFLRFDAIAAFFKKVLSILQPIIIGLVLAYLLNPIVNFAEARLLPLLRKHIQKEKSCKSLARSLSITFALFVAAVCIYILASIILPELLVSLRGLFLSLPELSESFMAWATAFLSENSHYGPMIEDLLTNAMDIAENWLKTDLLPQLNTWISALATGVLEAVGLVSDLFIGIIVSIYTLSSKEKFASQSKMLMYALFSPNAANVIIEVVRESHLIFGGFIIGKIIDSTIIGILCFIGCSLLKMPYTLLISIFVGVTNIIPFYGPYIGAIPSAILVLFVSPVQCIYFSLFILALQQLDGNIIGPAILSDRTGVSAFWIVTSTTLAGGLFGIIGMIMGVPVCAIIIYLVRRIAAYLLRKKNMPYESSDFTKLERVDSMEDGTLQYKKLLTPAEQIIAEHAERKEAKEANSEEIKKKTK